VRQTEAVPVSDRLAIVDLINNYVDAIDAKDWDRLDDFFTEDAVVWWNPESSTSGHSPILERMRQMLDTDEIVTYHHAASFTPSISGDSAEASVRIRAMHNGVGPRSGRFWESLAVQTTHFVRTSAGWRCSGFSWRVVVGLGSMDLFEGLRPGGTPTHGWPEVYEKFEYASPEWVDMLRGLIVEAIAGKDLSGVEFVLCEEYTNPPEHLRRPGSDSIGLCIRVTHGELHVTSEIIAAAQATKKMVCDYEWVKRYAMRYPDPKLRDQLMAEGLMQIEGEGDMSKLPAFWLALDTTSMIRPRTAW
jgi:ketosteroid isomerase-like protein